MRRHKYFTKVKRHWTNMGDVATELAEVKCPSLLKSLDEVLDNSVPGKFKDNFLHLVLSGQQ